MIRLIPWRTHRGSLLFDLWSTVYDVGWLQRTAYRPVHEAVLEEIGRHGARRVLDVGCGTGLLATRIERELPGVRTVGYDFSSGMLKRARHRAPTSTWVRGDALRLSFGDASFDTLVSTESFHWLPDPERALAEFHRVLAPGGRAFVALVNPPLELIGRVAQEVSSWIGQPFAWPTPGRMRRQTEEAGFQVEAQTRVDRWTFGPLLPAVLTVAVRSRPSVPLEGSAAPARRAWRGSGSDPAQRAAAGPRRRCPTRADRP